MDIIIKPLSSELLNDFLYYFDKVAFADNPEWSECYCHFYHFNGSIKKWGKQTKEQNRYASIQLINAGSMNGFLAYLDNKPIGWCNINSRGNYAKELYKYDTSEAQTKKIAGIVCFLIAHTHRKKGIAHELLKYAIEVYQNKGYDIIESYPRIGELSEAHSYRGPVSLYKSEGFEIYKEFKDYHVMRRYL